MFLADVYVFIDISCFRGVARSAGTVIFCRKSAINIKSAFACSKSTRETLEHCFVYIADFDQLNRKSVKHSQYD